MKDKRKSYLEDSDDFMSWFQEEYVASKDVNDFVKIGSEVYIKYKQSDLYNDLTKPQKRKANLKHLISDLQENPNLRMYHKKTIRPYVDGQQTKFTNVLPMHKKKKENKGLRDILPYDSDDE